MISQQLLTQHQSQYYAWLLTRRAAGDTVESLASTLVDSQVDLNPHQVEAALFACSNPLSREELQFLLDGISQNLGPSLLRVKGLVNIREEPGRPAVVQGAQHLLHSMTWLDRWPSADQRTHHGPNGEHHDL